MTIDASLSLPEGTKANEWIKTKADQRSETLADEVE